MNLKNISRSFRSLLLVGAGFAGAFALVYTWTPATAQTSPTRISVVDVNKVLTASKMGRAAYATLKKQQDDTLARFKVMDDEIKQLETSRASNPPNAAAITSQINAKKTTMQQAAKDADKTIQENRDRAMQSLDVKVKPVLDMIGKELRLAVVFNKFESGMVYADDSTDITDIVIQRLDAATP